jgi:transcriptional antiterminator NusG
MEEQVPEGRPEEETLENKVEAAEEPMAPEVDSTRAEVTESAQVVMPPEQEPLAAPVEAKAVTPAAPTDSDLQQPAVAPEEAATTEAEVEEPRVASQETAPAESEVEEPAVASQEPAPEAVAAEEVLIEAPAEEPRPTPAVPSGLRGGRLPLSEAAPEASSEPAWYVVHCYSGYENKVRHNLEQRIETMGMKDRIFDVVIPTQEEIEVRDGKRRTVERHIFPGYVLVNMSLSEESWYVVRNTPGVTGFVGMGNLPTALRPEEVSQIIKRMEAEAPTVKVSFKVGERVRIIDGPFNDFRGTVADIDLERTKVRVMVSFFGRETPVELDFLQVEKA